MAAKILVVEDNDDNRALVVKVLSRQGHQLMEAVSGEQALELAEADPPDLILMDLDLSGMSGLDATRRLKGHPRLSRVPVVALTAYAMVGDREKALEAGCDGYLAKPVDVRRLPDQVLAYLEGRGA
ncbi:MAG: response regulator [Deltaproteobacteria bacterium]|nr:response regulator [Deltaproteobacteria bacterium]